MTEKLESVVYDPTDYRLKDTSNMLGDSELSVENLANNPEAIRLILKQQYLQLVELKASQESVAGLTKKLEKVAAEREAFHIELASANEYSRLSLIEIPIGILSGIAINMLTTDWANLQGWALLLLSVVMLILLKVLKPSRTTVTQAHSVEET